MWVSPYQTSFYSLMYNIKFIIEGGGGGEVTFLFFGSVKYFDGLEFCWKGKGLEIMGV